MDPPEALAFVFLLETGADVLGLVVVDLILAGGSFPPTSASGSVETAHSSGWDVT